MAQSGERRARQQKAGRQIDPQKISTKGVVIRRGKQLESDRITDLQQSQWLHSKAYQDMKKDRELKKNRKKAQETYKKTHN